MDVPDYEREGDVEYPFEDTDDVGDENKIRGNWSSRAEYLLSAVGFIFGAGNVLRFPYLCYVNGGSAFLIPYFIMVLFAGFPMFFSELALGQFASIGCISVWKVVPLFKGIGISMFLISSVICIYYNVIASWSGFYFINSVKVSLPWVSCNNSWSSSNCSVFNRDSMASFVNLSGTLLRNASSYWGESESYGEDNETSLSTGFNVAENVMPSTEFFQHKVLSASDGFDRVGTIKWQLGLCLLVTWLLVFLFLFKGFKSLGKVAYFTVLTPFIILIFLLVRLLTLPGSFTGLLHFFSPNWRILVDFKIWGEAGVHAFYTLSVCTGGIATLGSFNRFHNNLFSDVWVLCIADFLFSVLACCLAFSAIGFVCSEMMIPFEQFLLKDGIQLIFEVLPEAIAKLPVAPLHASLYFAMIYFSILTTTTVYVETIVLALCDEFPESLRRNHRHVLTFACASLFCLGVPFCTAAGVYWVVLFDYYTPTWPLVILAFFESMSISWIYGVDNFLDNVKWMIRSYPSPYILWKIQWKFICPLLYLVVLAFAWFAYRPPHYNDYSFPEWGNLVGWGLSLLPLVIIPLTAMIKFCAARGTIPQRWRDLLCPEDDWGPALAVHRAEYYPLQIPEARRLIAPSIPESKVVDSAQVNGKDRIEGESKGNVSEASFGKGRNTPFLPSFDRETAI